MYIGKEWVCRAGGAGLEHGRFCIEEMDKFKGGRWHLHINCEHREDRGAAVLNG